MISSHPKRRPVMAANWKMNKTLEETRTFLEGFLKQLPSAPSCDVVICPPFTSLAPTGETLKGSKVSLGAQNMSDKPSGAYTGEISSAMLKSAG